MNQGIQIGPKICAAVYTSGHVRKMWPEITEKVPNRGKMVKTLIVMLLLGFKTLGMNQEIH